MFITDEIDVSALAYPPSPGISDGKTLFFDIETSGMSFDRSHITVIGAAYIKDQTITVMQWFADVPGSEPYILTDFYDRSANFNTIVTYNGSGFDLPYMEKKAAFWNLPFSLSAKEHTDLYRFSKPFADLFELENRKLKTVERELFIERNDQISGAECVDLYRAYLSTGDAALRDLILLHNREDIVNLIDVMRIRSYYSIKHGAFSVTDDVVTDRKELLIRCRLKDPVPREFRTVLPGHEIHANEDLLEVIFKGNVCVKKLFRKDYKDYFYLPEEDMAIHKSVGQFVDRKKREQAKASNCYEKFEGLFFEQSCEVIDPSFKDSCRDKRSFFRAEDLPEDPELLHQLCMTVI